VKLKAKDLQEFGDAVRDLVWRDDVIELLPEGDYGAGGCWALARAIQEFLGPPAELWAIASNYNLVEHVVVRYGDVYLDYDGASTERKLIARFLDEYTYPAWAAVRKLDPARARFARKVGIPCDPWVVKKLVSLMNRNFVERD